MIKNILESKITKNKLSIRSAAKEIGIAHTTLNRVLVGGNFDLETIQKISKWIGVKPAELLGFETNDDVSLLVSSIPGFKEILIKAVEKVKTGELKVSVLADISAYARFRVEENGGIHREGGIK